MRAYPETLIVLFSASIVSLSLLFLVFYLPRLLRKKAREVEHIEMDTVMGAFAAVGGEIKSLKEQLIMKERLAALGEVSAGIAHEFRNPMGVIAGYARLLLKETDENDKRREIVQAILDEIEEMNRIMEEMLKFSASVSISKTDFEIRGFVEDIVKSMGEVTAQVRFSPCDPLAVRGDQTLLRQAIRNLLQNAFHAGDNIRIDIEKIRLSGKDGISIAIKDNGRGIPESDFSRIFRPFYTTKRGGTGIGLALVQKIAFAHGGSVSVNSKEGKGSTFRLLLPLD